MANSVACAGIAQSCCAAEDGGKGGWYSKSGKRNGHVCFPECPLVSVDCWKAMLLCPTQARGSWGYVTELVEFQRSLFWHRLH